MTHRLTNLYGPFTAVRLQGGYSNDVFKLEGTSPPLVVKIASERNPHLVNEMNSLSLLDHKVAPRVHDQLHIGNERLVVMDYKDGKSGQAILETDGLGRAMSMYEDLAVCLAADIHSVAFTGEDCGILVFNSSTLDFGLDFVPEELSDASRRLIDRLPLTAERDMVLTHGDFGIHNVLYTDIGEVTVLDWEWAEWADPRMDVAWCCWFTAFHYPPVSGTLNAAFLATYLAHNPINITSDELKAYALYRILVILNLIRTSSSEVKTEWVKRLAWTLQHDFRV